MQGVNTEPAWDGPDTCLRGLRAAFPHWGIVYDPFTRTWIALRSGHVMLSATTPEDLVRRIADDDPGPRTKRRGRRPRAPVPPSPLIHSGRTRWDISLPVNGTPAGPDETRWDISAREIARFRSGPKSATVPSVGSKSRAEDQRSAKPDRAGGIAGAGSLFRLGIGRRQGGGHRAGGFTIGSWGRILRSQSRGP
jgi:hypothetical protein